jgi:hypothetical protein
MVRLPYDKFVNAPAEYRDVDGSVSWSALLRTAHRRSRPLRLSTPVGLLPGIVRRSICERRSRDARRRQMGRRKKLNVAHARNMALR